MNIKEKDMTIVVEALTERIKQLECELWWRDEKIAKLKAELGEKVGEKNETV